jgi:alkylation response protein AidB-like acyl-CoA dehydrogenase
MPDRLGELFARLPEFAEQRLAVPAPVAWDAVHAELGTELPSDFRELVEQTAFHVWLGIAGPFQ